MQKAMVKMVEKEIGEKITKETSERLFSKVGEILKIEGKVAREKATKEIIQEEVQKIKMPEVKPEIKPISEELEPLAKEARRYKTSNEFASQFGFEAGKKELPSQRGGEFAFFKRKTLHNAGFLRDYVKFKRVPTATLPKFEAIIDIDTPLKKAGFKNPQDFYNQATRAVPEVKRPEVKFKPIIETGKPLPNKTGFSGFNFKAKPEYQFYTKNIEDIKAGRVADEIKDGKLVGKIKNVWGDEKKEIDITLNYFDTNNIIKKHGALPNESFTETINNFDIGTFIKRTEGAKNKINLFKAAPDGYFVLGANQYDGYGIVTFFEKYPWTSRNKKDLANMIRRGSSFTSGGAADPSSALQFVLKQSEAVDSRAVVELSVVRGIPTPTIPQPLKIVKPKRPPTPARLLGEPKPKKITRPEPVLLKARLRAEARGAKRAAQKTAQEMRATTKVKVIKTKIETKAVVSAKLKEQAARQARKAELRSLKAGIKLRTAKEKIITQLKNKAIELDEVRKSIYQFTKEQLPLEKRGKLLADAANAKTRGELGGAFLRIIKERNRLIRKDIISNIEKIAANMEKLPLRWQDTIMTRGSRNFQYANRFAYWKYRFPLPLK